MPSNRSRSLPRFACLALLLGLFACQSGGPKEPSKKDRLSMHREFALRYFDQGDVQRAEQQVDKGLELAPRDNQLLLMKGWIRQRRGSTQDVFMAESIFRSLLGDKDYRVELGLAEALERKAVLFRETAAAVASGERVTERGDPAARAAELERDAEDALAESKQMYARALEHKPGEFQAMNGLQRVCALQGDLDESLEWANSLLELSGAEVEFWRTQLRRPDLTAEEEARLRELLDGSSRLQVETHMAASTLLMLQGRAEEALAHVDSALVLAPQTAGHHSRRAQILVDLGRPAEASFSLKEFLRLSELPFEHPDVRRAYDLLGACERALQAAR